MIKRIFKSILFLGIVLISLKTSAQITLKLKGDVSGRTSKSIIVLPRSKNPRQVENLITIPIVNNSFEYELTVSDLEAYQLIFDEELAKSVYTSIIFFPDTTLIKFNLHATINFDKNNISGGKINAAYNNFQAILNEKFKDKKAELALLRKSLMASGNYNSKIFDETIAQLSKTDKSDMKAANPIYKKLIEFEITGEDLTKAGQAYKLRQDSLTKEINKFKYVHINKNITIDNYFLMWFDVVNNAKTNSSLAYLIEKNYPNYLAKFPTHPYSEKISNTLAGIVKIFPGNKFVDFSAPDLNGKLYTLSNQIKGKVALIDLWATWCGPCILNAQNMVPVYQKYKNNGFTIVAVAREFGNTKALVNRLKEEKFGWLNLVDIDDKIGVWSKYAINGGGMQLLVDQNGIILALDPTPKQVEEWIKKLI